RQGRLALGFGAYGRETRRIGRRARRQADAPARVQSLGEHDVDYAGPQGRTDRDECSQQGRHGVARGADLDPFRTDREPHRTLQNSQKGQSLPPRTPENGVPAPPPARLSEGQGRSALSGADRKARPAPLRAGDHAMFNTVTKSIEWAGRTLTLETGKM